MLDLEQIPGIIVYCEEGVEDNLVSKWACGIIEKVFLESFFNRVGVITNNLEVEPIREKPFQFLKGGSLWS